MKLIEKSIASIKPLNDAVFEQANERLANQARPAGSLGMLEPASARLAAIFGTLDVRLDNKVIVTCAGDHGVTEEGVSLFPPGGHRPDGIQLRGPGGFDQRAGQTRRGQGEGGRSGRQF